MNLPEPDHNRGWQRDVLFELIPQRRHREGLPPRVDVAKGMGTGPVSRVFETHLGRVSPGHPNVVDDVYVDFLAGVSSAVGRY